MEYFQLRNGTPVPAIGLGTFTLGLDAIQSARHCGYRLFDTAYKYRNERAVGEALRGVERESLFVQSKVCARQLKGSRRWLGLDKVSPRKAYGQSCAQMGLDELDLFMVHSPFNGCEKYYRSLMALRDSGKLKAVGVCNYNQEQLIGFKGIAGEYPMVCQIEIHPYRYPQALVDFCQENDILVEARSPLAHGDALGEWERDTVLQSIAKAYGKSVPQVILRWITQQGIVALPRAKTPRHQEENISIFDFSLTEREVDAIKQMNRNLSFGFVSSQH